MVENMLECFMVEGVIECFMIESVLECFKQVARNISLASYVGSTGLACGMYMYSSTP